MSGKTYRTMVLAMRPFDAIMVEAFEKLQEEKRKTGTVMATKLA